ncbi:type I CRISPR-associated protein Cas7 [Methanobacterium alkalithermotolerans]|uniref:Type I CRISPR-associated protein Cas7 n=1 Tax=Methanobacterium alkalithermotolerans TaxID=2731220 RepID=A0A8T8K8T2_9EURY|nr:type I CRISPR-associated protein Cas7 [Methanobacterium alkalithermotolerans]QUH23985.1 type I CRISPR-associated protein Cas7 [Methanobacterium alkalithermotolerans]
MSEKIVKNYYQGIYLTETIMGNPNGDFVDNSPRNFDGKVFTTDKCIKFNVRRYINETMENIKDKKDIVFFYPRLSKDAEKDDAKYQTKDDIFKEIFGNDFDALKMNSPDVRMFGGTFSFTETGSKQIYGPIQLSYGKDINNAQIKRLQIGAPFATMDGQQTTTGSEAVVDDAIISYDITINPNNYPGLLKESDLKMFKESLWYGTNLRKSTSKKTDSKLLILIKFKNEREGEKVTALNIGELKELIAIKNGNERKNVDTPIKKIEIDTTQLNQKLEKYKDFIEKIMIYRDSADVDINLDVNGINEHQISLEEPTVLLNGD